MRGILKLGYIPVLIALAVSWLCKEGSRACSQKGERRLGTTDASPNLHCRMHHWTPARLMELFSLFPRRWTRTKHGGKNTSGEDLSRLPSLGREPECKFWWRTNTPVVITEDAPSEQRRRREIPAFFGFGASLYLFTGHPTRYSMAISMPSYTLSLAR